MDLVKRIYVEPKGYSKHFEDLKSIFEDRVSVLEKKMDILITTCSSILSYFERKQGEHECCSHLVLNRITQLEQIVQNSMEKIEKMSSINNGINSGNPPVLLVDETRQPNGLKAERVVALNTEEEIPNGSWLGDPNNPKCRVRVKISPATLIHINERCNTVQKMAVTLLDCLFPREVLAVSNISGKGKHSKQQLDPLLIYAIKCHLIYKFNMTEEEWHKIKQNLDSKCRGVWRKKIRGLPLESETTNPNILTFTDHGNEESLDYQQTLDCNSITVLRQGKDENLFEIQDGQTIKVFNNDDIKDLLSTSVELFSVEDNNCFSLGNHQLVITDSFTDKDPMGDELSS